MMKPFIVIQGPVATRSGYGDHTRDLVHSIIAMDKYEIDIISLPWGQCPMDALNTENEILILTTCWPFNSQEPGSERYIVTAEKASS